jgi:hypothetical protein
MTVIEPANLRVQIAEQVQAALDRHQPRKYRVVVDSDAILEDEGWYHVVVKSIGDVRDRDFYDAIARAESDLNEANNGHQYLLVPAIAD